MKNIIHFLRSFGPAMISSRHLSAMQQHRGLERFALARRNNVAVGMAGILLFSLLAYILTIAWQRQTIGGYIESRARILTIPKDDADWQFSVATEGDLSDAAAVYKLLVPTLESSRGRSFRELSLRQPGQIQRSGVTMARLTVEQSKWEPLLILGRDLTVAIPYLDYRRAVVYVNGQNASMFLASNRMAVSFDPTEFKAKALVIDVVFQDDETIAGMFKPIDEPLFVTTSGEYRNFLRFTALGQNTKLTWLSDTSLIVMAIFVLILFLFVDSSTETLGMALFLGFNAFSISIDYGWVPFIQKASLGIYASQMAIIFRLYFVLQIARVVSGRIAPWLIVGNVVAIPYAALTAYPDAEITRWVEGFEAYRDVIFCLISVSICLRVAVHLAMQNLPWRVAALLVASAASLQQIMSPLEYFFPVLSDSDAYTNIYYVATHLSVFLLAISAFVNISSLENRVRLMSALQTKQLVLSKELELAQSVQTAFMRLPTIPDTFDLVTQHDAQLQVSGDSYYVAWNAPTEKLTVILNDVTGHGIQAALKASVCQVIAKSIWEDPDAGPRTGTAVSSQLERYEDRLRHFFSSVQDSPDVVTFVGGELDQNTGLLALYRMNFTFPYIISPSEENASSGEEKTYWNVEMISLENLHLLNVQLTPQSFVIFISDGFVGGSRDAFAMMKMLRQKLVTVGPELTANDIRALILADPRLNRAEVDDDRTVVILQWRPKTGTLGGSPRDESKSETAA